MAATSIPKHLQERLASLTDPIVRPLIRMGVHPNVVTTFGFAVTVSAGVTFFTGRVRLAGLLVLLGGVLDIFDGRVARGSGRASVFGSFYDSTLDRISEVIVFLGIMSLYVGGSPHFSPSWMVYVVALALSGSLMVSYTRALAEKLGVDCQIGLMQRLERVLLLGGVCLLFGAAWNGAALRLVLIAMAVLANFTALQRIVWVYRHTRPVPVAADRPSIPFISKRRMNS
jgi:CDP-diacylglycerol--glycerol-3-phosphate 3-phosphatidyltransferase